MKQCCAFLVSLFLGFVALGLQMHSDDLSRKSGETTESKLFFYIGVLAGVISVICLILSYRRKEPIPLWFGAVILFLYAYLVIGPL